MDFGVGKTSVHLLHLLPSGHLLLPEWDRKIVLYRAGDAQERMTATNVMVFMFLGVKHYAKRERLWIKQEHVCVYVLYPCLSSSPIPCANQSCRWYRSCSLPTNRDSPPYTEAHSRYAPYASSGPPTHTIDKFVWSEISENSCNAMTFKVRYKGLHTVVMDSAILTIFFIPVLTTLDGSTSIPSTFAAI